MMQERADAVVVFSHNENWVNRQLIVRLAEETRLPALFFSYECVEIGGLMAYGLDWPDVARHVASVVTQIFDGTKPGEIPLLDHSSVGRP
jgi:putative tryptophan/tyrosine transport system substrate-binding protein